MEIPVPDGCTVHKLELRAETQEAFEAACETLELGKPLTVGPLMTGAHPPNTAYSFQFARSGDDTIEVRGPETMHKVVVEDA